MEIGVATAAGRSKVVPKQKKLLLSTQNVLAEIVNDVRIGLLETVGVESSFSVDQGCCSVVLDLPAGTDTEKIAVAVDLENVESWLDTDSRVHLGISPWYSTKDVDQTVLAAVKVIHVLLGLHASDANRQTTFKEKLLGSISEIIEIQRRSRNRPS